MKTFSALSLFSALVLVLMTACGAHVDKSGNPEFAGSKATPLASPYASSKFEEEPIRPAASASAGPKQPPPIIK